MSQKNASERRRGNKLGFWFFRTAVKIFGLGGAYGLLYIVSLYYLAFDHTAVKASLAYVRRRFPGHGPVRRIFDVHTLFVNQGKSLIDRYYVVAGGPDIEIELSGFERIRDLLTDGKKGLILLTAHVGNWQVAMTALRKLGRTVYLMMRPEDNVAAKQALTIDNENNTVRVIYTGDSLGGVVDAIKAIDRGDLLSIMGDRTYHYDSVEASLLGGAVRFPYGAFSIAAAAQCPVVVLLSAKVGDRRYIADVSQVIDPPSGGRGKKQEEIKACVQKFATILEEYAARYPYQWFVFRDMWQSNE